IKKYVINPVEAREASLDERSTLKMEFAIPTEVETLTGFTALDDDALEAFRNEKGLAMDHADIVFCQNYF
ncbi:MAG TPA: phosphoribosylformylglycinamidine synthase, partial [Subdoligranulum sp.]|nr:phosphoribosylformylglycinamidine synthase [Subdoligranulum sp.]